jgi:hypothetical protein
VPERAEEMIQKSLRLALFVSAQCLREAYELNESGFQVLSHGSMLPKSVVTDKRRSARLLRPRSGQDRACRVPTKLDHVEGILGREGSAKALESSVDAPASD